MRAGGTAQEAKALKAGLKGHSLGNLQKTKLLTTQTVLEYKYGTILF